MYLHLYSIAVWLVVSAALAAGNLRKLYFAWDENELRQHTVHTVGFDVVLKNGTPPQHDKWDQMIKDLKFEVGDSLDHCSLVRTILKKRLPLYEKVLVLCFPKFKIEKEKQLHKLKLYFDARQMLIEERDVKNCTKLVVNEMESAFTSDGMLTRLATFKPLPPIQISKYKWQCTLITTKPSKSRTIAELQEECISKLNDNDLKPLHLTATSKPLTSSTMADFIVFYGQSDSREQDAQKHGIKLKPMGVMRTKAATIKSATNVCASLISTEIAVITLDGQLLKRRATVKKELTEDELVTHIEQAVPQRYRTEHQIIGTSYGTHYFTGSASFAISFIYLNIKDASKVPCEKQRLRKLFYDRGKGFSVAALVSGRIKKCMVSRVPLPMIHYQVEGLVNLSLAPYLIDRDSEDYRKFESAILSSLGKTLKSCNYRNIVSFRVNKIFWNKTGAIWAHSTIFFDARTINVQLLRAPDTSPTSLLQCKRSSMDPAYIFTETQMYEETTNVFCGRRFFPPSVNSNVPEAPKNAAYPTGPLYGVILAVGLIAQI